MTIRPSARPRAPSAASPFLLLLALAATLATPAAGAGSTPTVEPEWENTGIVVALPAAGYEMADEPAGCAATVRLDLDGGARRTLPSAALGPGSCTEAALCAPYVNAPGGLVTACRLDGLLTPLALHEPDQIHLTEVTLGCVHRLWLNVDHDGDGTTDARLGPAYDLMAC